VFLLALARFTPLFFDATVTEWLRPHDGPIDRLSAPAGASINTMKKEFRWMSFTSFVAVTVFLNGFYIWAQAQTVGTSPMSQARTILAAMMLLSGFIVAAVSWRISSKGLCEAQVIAKYVEKVVKKRTGLVFRYMTLLTVGLVIHLSENVCKYIILLWGIV
jgi:hypothetical protein